MTFATHKDTPGRQAANVLELDLDFCTRSYGVLPCVAILARQNYTLRSQEIDNAAHTKVNLTVVANSTLGDDGTMTADKIEETAVSGQHQILQSIASFFVIGRQYTTSAFVRKQERARMRILFFDAVVFGGTILVEIDLFNLTITSTGGNPDSFGIRPAKNGLFRVWVTATAVATGTATPHIGLLNDAGLNNYLGIVGNGIDVWGWQTREGALPGKYAVTTSAVVDGMGVIDDLCFNTFGTCQDTANYNKEVRTLRFIDTLVRPFEFLDAYPAILSVRYAPTVLKPGGNLSIRGQVTVVLQDFATTDNDIDDYVRERTYDPEDRGTFFGKLKARHSFYIGRPMRVLEGYIDDATLTDFRTREFIIDDISGPTADGKVIVKGKDILSLAADLRAKAPTASTNTLRAAMDTTQTTLLPQTGEAILMIAGDKHVRINDEIIELTSESPTDTLNVVRQKGGTPPSAHVIDDGIQECLTYENTPVIDVIQELLQTFANIPASFIPFTDWELEETETLIGYDVETIISEPTGVLTLLKELVAITLLDIWYDDVAQEIKLKLQTPFTSVSEVVNDDEDILADTLKVKDLNNQRLTRILIYYGMRNFARDLKETENFSLINFQIEADKEGVNKYNDERIKTIFSRWFDASNKVQVQLTSQRLLDRFGITPKAIEFDLDAKDVERLTTGDVFDLTSRIEQAIDGNDATNRYQVTELKTLKPGSQYRYKCEAFFQDPTPESLTISTPQSNFDLFVALGGPPAAVDITVTINAGILVKGLNGNPAFTTAGLHPDSTLTLINNGDIHGAGGGGALGGGGKTLTSFNEKQGCRFRWSLGQDTGGGPGQAGSDALVIEIASVEIDNTNGEIFGAGGGGGAGAKEKGGLDDGTYNGGGGGGGGLGEDTSAGGGGGIILQGTEECSTTRNDGPAGTGGTTGAGGTGGDVIDPDGFDGGGGANDWGIAGDNAPVSGGTGGVGGFAVRLNGASIVFTGGDNPAQVKGSVA